VVIYLSLLICILGALCYALASNPKLAEMGRLAFGAGLLAFLLQAATVLHALIR
jgi:Na+/phosphate symporter